MKKTIQKPLLGILLLLLLGSCKKYLDQKVDQKLATIETIQDMQALLDNYADLNYSDPAMGEACADNYFLTDEVYNARSEADRNLYNWAADNIFEPSYNPWNDIYTQVYITNVVLQAVDEKGPGINDAAGLSAISAQALFFRAKAFLNVAGVWTMPYNVETAQQRLGIPLRLTADFNERSERANLEQTYGQILNDLKKAIPFLPKKNITPMRASKAAAYGMLSRAYLQMRDYEHAGLYADSCLQIQNTLLDYNTLTATANFPIAKLNVEVIFEGRFTTHNLVAQSRAFINPDLYTLYNANDLRKTVFFKSSGTNYVFKGNYEGGATFFNGLATDEMFLTRAECFIRTGKLVEGLADLNKLLKNRFKTGTFTNITTNSVQEALVIVKAERRKELLFRAQRWNDIKRLNEEGDNIVLTRTNNGSVKSLVPKSLLYALAIPVDVVRLSGMEQNPR